VRRKGKVTPMKLKPYGGKKSKTRGHLVLVDAGVCCQLIDETPNNERVNNRQYKILKEQEEEYGEYRRV